MKNLAVGIILMFAPPAGAACSTPQVETDFAEVPLSEEKQQLVSAQVILRSASGQSPDSNTPITADSVNQYLPSTEDVSRVRSFFLEAGFEVSEVVGISFSITAPIETFEEKFQAALSPDGRGSVLVNQPAGLRASAQDDSPSRKLPLNDLPTEVGESVVEISFGEPPDFGPGNY